jgi:mRNA interferase MazF
MCETRCAIGAILGRGGDVGGTIRMARILRGEIRWADLNPVKGHEQGGQRPVLIISQDVFNHRSGTVIAMAITSQSPRAGFPLTMELKNTKLPKSSWVKISQIRTLSTVRIGKKLGLISPEELDYVLDGFNEIVGA